MPPVARSPASPRESRKARDTTPAPAVSPVNTARVAPSIAPAIAPIGEPGTSVTAVILVELGAGACSWPVGDAREIENMSNDDITRNFHGGNVESAAAKELNRKQASQQRARITAIAKRRRKQGVTCDEAEQLLNMPHQSCSARFTELKRDGVFVPASITRPTRHGGNARVMLFSDAAASNTTASEIRHHERPRRHCDQMGRDLLCVPERSRQRQKGQTDARGAAPHLPHL
jgi:hypothetical protein